MIEMIEMIGSHVEILCICFFPSMMDATGIGPSHSPRGAYLTDVSVFCMPIPLLTKYGYINR
jgi:hypothetical protein